MDTNEHARELAKLGASKGGIARRAALSSEERKEIGRAAAAARWKNQGDVPSDILQATYGTEDKPLPLGGAEIPCYIVEDGNEPLRLLVLTGVLKALNISPGGSSRRTEGTRLYRFMISKSIRPFVSDELLAKVNSPILFRTPTGRTAYGYEATILADIVEAVLAARRAGGLNRQQHHIAQQCEVLMSGWARLGILSLVDEITGYQYFRARHALEEILDRFISSELMKWQKTFPDEYYSEMFRLRKWAYSSTSNRKPQVVGVLTNDIVYGRLAPGVLEELKRLTPRSPSGSRAHKFHQRLTEDIGHPRLREHLNAIIAFMRAADSWDEFARLVDRAFPKINETIPLPIKAGSN